MADKVNNRYSNDNGFRDMNLEKKIMDRTAHFRLPSGKSKEEALSSVKLRIKADSGRSSLRSGNNIIRLIYTISSVAAVALLIFGIWFLFLHSLDNKIIADKGTHIDHQLPDGSRVTINADSKIVYKKREFNQKRDLILEGEAFFEVTRGNPFHISTSNADITVLGTSFNVCSRGNLFKVSCITGKIKVNTATQSVEITPGESATLKGNDLISYPDKNSGTSAGWIRGEFYFENSSLDIIFKEIERQFNVKFVAKEMNEKHFTGSFTNNNLKDALEIVCIPMGLKYEIGNNGKILVQEKAQ